MSKTVPQLVKKIDRDESDKVEQISAPYAWQKPALPKSDVGPSEQQIKTVPVGGPARKRAR